jgi:PAS domain S-box-containing protein
MLITISSVHDFIHTKGMGKSVSCRQKIKASNKMQQVAINKNESSNHFEAFFEFATLCILVIDGSGYITAINPFALKEFGYSEKELIGEKIEKLIPSRFHNQHIKHREKYMVKPQNRPIGLGMNLFAFKKNGSKFPVQITLSNYHIDGAKYVIAFINNISESKKAEAKIEKLHNELEATVEKRTRALEETLNQLEISNKKLEDVQSFQKTLLDNAGAMIIATDEKGIIKLFNPEASVNIGYHESEVINKNTPLLFHDKNEITTKRKELFRKFGITIKDDFKVLVEKAKRNIHEEEHFRYIRKNGTSFPISLTITAIRDTGGEITGFMGIAIDVSKHKKLEDELNNFQHLFLQLLRNFPDGAISIIDNKYNFIYTGGELHTRLNSDPKQLIGGKIYSKFPEPLRQIIQTMLGNIFMHKNIISDFELPYPIAGDIYVMDAFPLKEEDGSVNKAGVIIRNISQRKRIEQELQQALEKEKELSELKSRFVSMASHEFRTPLSTVLSSTYLIEKYTTADEQPKREKHLQRIVSSANMLTDILNDFLSVGKIEEGKIQVRPAQFNIQEMIIAITGELKSTLKKQQNILYHHEGNPNVLLDASLLKHIIMNLVSNASKFSPDTSSIDIKTISHNHHIILSVKDHGIGISKEDQKHLMERFFRGANAGNIQGTGLGLHIVSKYAELMNGKVECKSELEKGTEFIITFITKTG